jgi:alpha-L-rhamnosidase
MQVDRRDILRIGAAGIGVLAPAPAFAASPKAPPPLMPVDLRVCGLTEPLALGRHAPRFGWRLAGPGGSQTAYRIAVAREREALTQGGPLLWDTGRVASPASLDIAYDGPALPARARLWWQVTVWSEGGATPLLSAPSFWETGLIADSDWVAGWLAAETETARLDRAAGLHWVAPEGTTPIGGKVAFRTEIKVSRAQEAVLFVSGHALGGVWLNGQPVATSEDDPASWTTMAPFPLKLARGPNVVAIELTRQSGIGIPPAALATILRIGPDLRERRSTAEGWTAMRDAPEGWQQPDFDASGWAPASPSTATIKGEPWPLDPAMLLRRAFSVARPIRSARLYATALGTYDAWLNGRRVSDARLAPSSTDASKRILYQAYDVTALLRDGANVLGFAVGDGWYASEYSNGSRYAFGPAPRRLRAQLELTYADGGVETIATGPGWTIAPSPILSSEIYDGEVFDARLEQPGWSAPGFAAANWLPARAADAPAIAIDPEDCPPIRVTEERQATAITQPAPDVSVVDFGQNFAGWVRLRVRGRAGTRVELLYAEVLRADGRVDQSNLRTAWARDTYILKGEGEEVWEPRFTYHGFRYVELRGLPEAATTQTLTGLVGHTDLSETGVLRVGDPVIQKFWQNSLWSQRSNFFGLPTDCPQRDERLGWMGDAGMFWPAAAWNMDVGAYTARVMADMRAGQGRSGNFPDVIPPFVPGVSTASPGWADAGVILPHTTWRRSGDTGVIRNNWDAMDRYLGWIAGNNPGHLWKKSRGADYGDWLAVDANPKTPGEATTPKDLVGTAFWAADAAMMAEMAAAIGRSADAARYRALFDAIRAAFVAAYVKADGSIGNGSQTSYVLPIRFGLLSPAARAEAGRRLAADIARRGGTLSTGFLGTPFILDALVMAGQETVAVGLLLQRRYPSWGYMVEKGATTMWERWNSDTGDVSMNSYNHYAFGAIGDFLFRRIAGIDPVDPGFRRIRIAPIFDARLGSGGATYRSVAGEIRTDWRRDAAGITLEAMLPPNVAGEVVLPAGEARLDGATLGRRGLEAGQRRIVIGPGTHRFTVTPA